MANTKKKTNRTGKSTAKNGLTKSLSQCRGALAEAQVKAGILDLIPTPVMSIDRDFNITYMNYSGASAVGRRQEEVLGMKCFSLFNTEHCNTENCQLKKAMEQDGVFTGDTVANLRKTPHSLHRHTYQGC